jgi:uncharacterized protein YceH (UPF0502 family)
VETGSVEIRVLGCLIEKQRTTPEAYPLTLNALRLACNQSTNRDPIVDYDDATIRAALDRLGRRGWTRLASGPGSRAPKFRHLLDDALGLGEDELSVLSVLMVRGPQTPGELKQRTERMHHFPDLASLENTLERLIERDHVGRLERRPGQKENRYEQLLGREEGPTEDTRPSMVEHPPAPSAAEPTEDRGALQERVARLEDDVAELRRSLDELRARSN